MLVIALLSPALAVEPPMDCTGRVPAVCAHVNRLVELVNTEAGSDVLTQSSPTARLRPTALYDRILPVRQASDAGGCTVLGTMGGIYDLQAGVWDGLDHRAFFGQGTATGVVSSSPATWSGVGSFGAFGGLYGLYNSRGQVAGSAGNSNSQYAMGTWIRLQGSTGIYANLVGVCGGGDYSAVFEDWYVGSLPTFCPLC